MNGHGIDVCACGAVIAQCRCMEHTERRVVQQSCSACAGKLTPPRPETGSAVSLAVYIAASSREPERVRAAQAPDFYPPPQFEMTFRFTRAEIEAASCHKNPCTDGQTTDKQGAQIPPDAVSESPTKTRRF